MDLRVEFHSVGSIRRCHGSPPRHFARKTIVSGRSRIDLVRSFCRVLVLLITLAFLEATAIAREGEGTVPLVRGVRNRVYGTLRDSELIVSNGQEQRTLTVDHHGHFSAELPEGGWRVIDLAPKDRKYVETGQTFTVTPGNRVLKIRVALKLR